MGGRGRRRWMRCRSKTAEMAPGGGLCLSGVGAARAHGAEGNSGCSALRAGGASGDDGVALAQADGMLSSGAETDSGRRRSSPQSAARAGASGGRGCRGRWRPPLAGLVLSRDGAGVPTVVAAFNLHVSRAHAESQCPRGQWKGGQKDLLPMSEDMLRAFIWDSLAFHATLPVLQHCVNAIKVWHRRLGFQPPADGPGDYRRLTHSLAWLQGPTLDDRFHSRPGGT